MKIAPKFYLTISTMLAATLVDRSAPNDERPCNLDKRKISMTNESTQHITRHNFLSCAWLVTSTLPCLANAANLPQSNGADLSRTGSVDTLIPIIQMRRSILKSKGVIPDETQQHSSMTTQQCTRILQQLSSSMPREEKPFKRIFDAYSTPVSYKQKFLDQNAFLVYYSKGFDGPGRPNIESDGEDVTNSIQTLQYGFRNEAWAAMDDVFTELEFGAKGIDNTVDTKDLRDLIDKALMAFDAYLALAPEKDLNEASLIDAGS